MYFKLPEFRLFEFVKFTEMMDITILICYKQEEILVNDSFVGWIRLNKNHNIPKEVQVEKINEKFGKFVKEA